MWESQEHAKHNECTTERLLQEQAMILRPLDGAEPGGLPKAPEGSRTAREMTLAVHLWGARALALWNRVMRSQ